MRTNNLTVEALGKLVVLIDFFNSLLPEKGMTDRETHSFF